MRLFGGLILFGLLASSSACQKHSNEKAVTAEVAATGTASVGEFDRPPRDAWHFEAAGAMAVYESKDDALEPRSIAIACDTVGGPPAIVMSLYPEKFKREADENIRVSSAHRVERFASKARFLHPGGLIWQLRINADDPRLGVFQRGPFEFALPAEGVSRFPAMGQFAAVFDRCKDA